MRVAVDTVTADDEQARWRYVVVTHDSTGPCTLVSRRGQTWVRRRNFPSGTGDPLGVVFAVDRCIAWDASAIYYALTDEPGLPASGTGASQLRDEGEEWSVATLPASPGAIRAVAYGGNSSGGTTVAVTSTKLLVSNTNGVSWTLATTIAQSGRAVAGALETYVAIGSDAGNGLIVRSTDGGATWSTATTLTSVGSDTTWRLAVGIAEAVGAITFVAFKADVANPRLHVSVDSGVTWTAVTTDAALAQVTALTWHDGVWVATLNFAPYALASNDLERWLPVPIPVTDAVSTGSQVRDVVFAHGAWLVVTTAELLQGAPAVDPGPEGYTPGTTATLLSDAGWLRGRTIATTAPTSGQVYAWNSGTSQWEPTTAASSPTTTRGDLIVRGASADQRLAVGASGRYLRSDGTDPGWSTIPSTDVTGLPWSDRISPATVQTTDATTTTLKSYTTTSGKGHTLDLLVSAVQSDRSAQVSFKILASITNAAGTCTVRNQVITADDPASTWVVVVDVSGTDIRVRVTGAGGTTIDWCVAGTLLVHGS
jgi:hypothetical protein